MLPNGKRVNYHKHGFTIGDTPLNLTGRTANPMPVPPFGAPSALTSLYRGEGASASAQPPGSPYQPPTITTSYGPYGEDRLLDGSMLDSTAYSTNGSVFGSPRDDDVVALRLGMALSPRKGLSALDAPMPASFDSNGISHAARFPAAPWSSSMPTKFGLESPAASLNVQREATPSEALRMLHTSAFYGSDQMAPPPSHPSSSNSPPQPIGPIGDEYFEKKRTLHSSRLSRGRMMSASMPKTVDHDWDHDFSFAEEDYVPKDLSDLLTPAEKARRGSTRDEDLNSYHDPLAAATASAGGSMRFGSPGAASPSRWGPLFQRQREEELESQSPRPSSKFPPATFGHVGSPLRNSSLAHEMSGAGASGSFVGSVGTLGAIGSNGSPRPSPGVRSGSDSLSALTQQLQRSRLSEAIDAAGNPVASPGHHHTSHSYGHSPLLHPSSAATPRNVGVIGRERGVVERHASNGSTGSSRIGAAPTPKDDDDGLFDMDEEDEQPQPQVQMIPTQAPVIPLALPPALQPQPQQAHAQPPPREKAKKRTSSGLATAQVWSYAGVVAGRGAPTAASTTATNVTATVEQARPIGGR
jgi:hypothetical protein